MGIVGRAVGVVAFLVLPAGAQAATPVPLGKYTQGSAREQPLVFVDARGRAHAQVPTHCTGRTNGRRFSGAGTVLSRAIPVAADGSFRSRLRIHRGARLRMSLDISGRFTDDGEFV